MLSLKRIGFITDLHLDEPDPFGKKVDPRANFDRILDHISKSGIEEIVFGGDIGESSAHPYFFSRIEHYRFRLILGNHDHFTEVTNFYNPIDRRTELFYHLEDEWSKYLFLDSSSDSISNQQISWLTKELDTSKTILVFIHHPVLQVETPADKLFPLKNRDQLKNLLVQIQNEVIIVCGHYHLDDEHTFKNVKQIITPSACFQLVKHAKTLEIDNTSFGYRIINFNGSRFETELILFQS